MEPVLPIDDVDYDRSVEETGDISLLSSPDEYLAWVRNQASRLPTVFRANNAQFIESAKKEQTKYMPKIDDVQSCPPEFLPDENWEKTTVHEFSDFRLKLYNRSLDTNTKERKMTVPPMKNRYAWLKVCLGFEQNVIDEDAALEQRRKELADNLGIAMESEDINNNENDIDENNDIVEEDECVDEEPWLGDSKVAPSCSFTLQLDQVMTQRVLGYLVDWLEENELSIDCCRWVYALLARVEKPLYRDVVASIRQLYRRCCYLRYQFANKITASTQNNKHSNMSEVDEMMLANLNLLISISGYYFGQGEAYAQLLSTHNPDMEQTKDNSDNEEDDEDHDKDSDSSSSDGEEMDMGGVVDTTAEDGEIEE